jgi:hypothetical protein
MREFSQGGDDVANAKLQDVGDKLIENVITGGRRRRLPALINCGNVAVFPSDEIASSVSTTASNSSRAWRIQNESASGSQSCLTTA